MEMLVIGALITIVTEIVKRAIKKFNNKDLAVSAVYLCSLGLSIVAGGVYFYAKANLSPEIIAQIATIWGVSFGIYETAIKRVVNPALDNYFKTAEPTPEEPEA